MTEAADLRVPWQGRLISIQPRIRLMRSFDQGAHSYLGYSLIMRGSLGGRDAEFSVGIGKAAQAKHAFRVGDLLSGSSVPVADPRSEPVDYYRTSGLKLIERTHSRNEPPPPWAGPAPDLATYRQRGHRRLSVRTYKTKSLSCIWGCRMPVVIIVDHWNPHKKRYRFETFCYGPRACADYGAGPRRRVPGRRGMTWIEENWVDEDATSHRSEEE